MLPIPPFMLPIIQQNKKQNIKKIVFTFIVISDNIIRKMRTLTPVTNYHTQTQKFQRGRPILPLSLLKSS